MDGQRELFTGSGFSHGAGNVMDKAQPMGNGRKNAPEHEIVLLAMNPKRTAEDCPESLGEAS